MTRCVGYVRVSTERQAGEVFTSLADQRAAIERLAASLGVTVDRWYADEGASGASVEARPAFQQLLADCEAAPQKRQGLVLCLNDSRFGRFPESDEATYWRVHLHKLGWHVRFVESDDVHDPIMRPVIRAIGSAQASEYRRNIQRNARRGRKGAAEQGYWGGRAPFGYRRKVVHPAGRERVLDEGVRKAPDEKVVLVPDEREAAIVAEAFRRYASGTESIHALSRWLTAVAPERRWYTQNVVLMLKNPAFVGDVMGGRRPGSDDIHGKRWKMPETAWYGKQDAHPAIVSRELYAEVQARIALNKKQTRGATGDYLLTGIVTCGVCGRHYRGAGHTQVRRTGQLVSFYACVGGQPPLPSCPGKLGTVTKHRLEGAVLDVLTEELSSKVARRAIVRALDSALRRVATGQGPNTKRVEKERAALERKRARLVQAITDGTVTADEAAPQLAQIRASLATLEREREDARFGAERARTLAAERDRLAALALDFPTNARRLSGPALRELIRPWLKAAVFDKRDRMLTLTIRRLPVVSVVDSSTSAGLGSQDEARTVTRQVRLAIGRTGWERVS